MYTKAALEHKEHNTLTCCSSVLYCSVLKVMENSSLLLKSLVRKPFFLTGCVSWYFNLSLYSAPFKQQPNMRPQRCQHFQVICQAVWSDGRAAPWFPPCSSKYADLTTSGGSKDALSG